MTGASDASRRRLSIGLGNAREQTGRTRGLSLPQIIEGFAPYHVGWRSNFAFCQTPRVLACDVAVTPRCPCVVGGKQPPAALLRNSSACRNRARTLSMAITLYHMVREVESLPPLKAAA